MVCLGIIGGYYQYKKMLEISEAINSSKNRPTCYVLGGHGPAPEPEYFLQKSGADAVVIGEGERTLLEIAQAVAEKKSFHHINGIAFLENDTLVKTPPRELIKDIDTIPWPAYDLFPIEIYRLLRLPHASNSDFVMPILSSRGCTFECNFCYRMDKGYRPRSPEAILEEVAYLQKTWGITYIDFADELLMASRQHTIDICNAILASGLTFKWYCNGRLNYATKDILQLMRQCGCVYINYGIEAFDNTVLKNMNKALTTTQITRGIEATLDAEISPGFNFIFGNIGDNQQVLDNDVEFLLKYNDHSELRTIRPVTPYPGCQLYNQAKASGAIKSPQDFYEVKHTNSDLLTVNFTELSDDEFYGALKHANQTLIDSYYARQREQAKEAVDALYTKRDANFRGFRQT